MGESRGGMGESRGGNYPISVHPRSLSEMRSIRDENYHLPHPYHLEMSQTTLATWPAEEAVAHLSRWTHLDHVLCGSTGYMTRISLTLARAMDARLCQGCQKVWDREHPRSKA